MLFGNSKSRANPQKATEHNDWPTVNDLGNRSSNHSASASNTSSDSRPLAHLSPSPFITQPVRQETSVSNPTVSPKMSHYPQERSNVSVKPSSSVSPEDSTFYPSSYYSDNTLDDPRNQQISIADRINVAQRSETAEEVPTLLNGNMTTISADTLGPASEPSWLDMNSTANRDLGTSTGFSPTVTNSMGQRAVRACGFTLSPEEEELTFLLPASSSREGWNQDNTAPIRQQDTSLPSPASISMSIEKPTNDVATAHQHTAQPSIMLDRNGLSTETVRGDIAVAQKSLLVSRDWDFKRRVNSIQSDGPRKPALQFAIQDADGVPNEDPGSLFSLKEISCLDVKGLFELVAHYSGEQLEDLNDVTFRYEWGKRSLAHALNKQASQEYWKTLTGKMGKIFMHAQGEYPKKKKFLVWVNCGDRTNLKEESGDESEG